MEMDHKEVRDENVVGYSEDEDIWGTQEEVEAWLDETVQYWDITTPVDGCSGSLTVKEDGGCEAKSFTIKSKDDLEGMVEDHRQGISSMVTKIKEGQDQPIQRRSSPTLPDHNHPSQDGQTGQDEHEDRSGISDQTLRSPS